MMNCATGNKELADKKLQKQKWNKKNWKAVNSTYGKFWDKINLKYFEVCIEVNETTFTLLCFISSVGLESFLAMCTLGIYSPEKQFAELNTGRVEKLIILLGTWTSWICLFGYICQGAKCTGRII